MMEKPFETLHRSALKSSKRTLLDWLLPRRCLMSGLSGDDGLDLNHAWYQHLPRPDRACERCANPLPSEYPGLLCAPCKSHLPAFDTVQAAFLYEFPVDVLVQDFKFAGRLEAGALLARLLAASINTRSPPDALIPVPLHTDRLRERGFDQALLLAADLAHALNLRLCGDALVRVRATPAQSGLKREQRQRNLRRAFAVSAPVPAHVALVDDVLTTGSTAQACSVALKKAGAERVDVWVVARA